MEIKQTGRPLEALANGPNHVLGQESIIQIQMLQVSVLFHKSCYELTHVDVDGPIFTVKLNVFDFLFVVLQF